MCICIHICILFLLPPNAWERIMWCSKSVCTCRCVHMHVCTCERENLRSRASTSFVCTTALSASRSLSNEGSHQYGIRHIVITITYHTSYRSITYYTSTFSLTYNTLFSLSYKSHPFFFFSTNHTSKFKVHSKHLSRVCHQPDS